MRRRPATAALVCVAVGVAGAMLTAGAPARAAAAPGFDPLVDDVVAPLLADCSRVSPAGREYARMHDLDICDAGRTPLDRPLPTEAVGGEECGDITLTVTGRGGGLVAVAWRAASRTGPITGVDLDITVMGRLAGEVRHVTSSTAGRLSRDEMVRFVGSGRAQVALSGTVETFTTTCTVTPALTRIFVR